MYTFISAKADELSMKQIVLGVSPLANVGNRKQSFLNEKLCRFMYQYTAGFSQTRQSFTIRNNYVDTWEARYLSTSKNNKRIFNIIHLKKFYLGDSTIKMNIYK